MITFNEETKEVLLNGRLIDLAAGSWSIVESVYDSFNKNARKGIGKEYLKTIVELCQEKIEKEEEDK